MLTVRFRPEAEIEYQEAQRWYHEQRPGLEDESTFCVDEALERIRRDPQMYPVRYRHLRRALVHRFPYAIYYEVAVSQIKIFSVFHTSKNLRLLQTRAL